MSPEGEAPRQGGADGQRDRLIGDDDDPARIAGMARYDATAPGNSGTDR